MAPGGLTAEPDGDCRWRVVEAGRPRSEAVVAVISGRPGAGFTVEAGAGAGSGPPPGPYGSVDDAVGALETWRLARFEGRRD
jgi:hypothetical protein